jgi:hypothetical protein
MLKITAHEKPPIIQQSKSPRKKNPITFEVVKEHLESLGYSADVLDPQDLQDFIKELQELWEKDGLKEFPHHQDDQSYRDDSLQFESEERINSTITSKGSKITRKMYNPHNIYDDSPVLYHENTLLTNSFSGPGEVGSVLPFSQVEGNSHHHHKIVTIKAGESQRFEADSHERYSRSDADKHKEDEEAANIISSLNLSGFKKKVVEQKMKSKSASTTRSSSPAMSYGADEYSFEDYSSSHVSTYF